MLNDRICVEGKPETGKRKREESDASQVEMQAASSAVTRPQAIVAKAVQTVPEVFTEPGECWNEFATLMWHSVFVLRKGTLCTSYLCPVGLL